MAQATETFKSVEEYLKNITPETLNKNFLARVDYILKSARLSKKVYFKGIAEQTAEKSSLLSTDRKTIYKLELVKSKKGESMWMYVSYKITQDENK